MRVFLNNESGRITNFYPVGSRYEKSMVLMTVILIELCKLTLSIKNTIHFRT